VWTNKEGHLCLGKAMLWITFLLTTCHLAKPSQVHTGVHEKKGNSRGESEPRPKELKAFFLT
jgi:hypothetical protein